MPTATWMDNGEGPKEALSELSSTRSSVIPGNCRKEELRLPYSQNSTYASWINQHPHTITIFSHSYLYITKTLLSVCLFVTFN